MRLSLLFALSITACNPITYDLGYPLTMQVDPAVASQPLFDPRHFGVVFSETATSLGSSVGTESPNPPIRFVYDTYCQSPVTAYVDGELSDAPARQNSVIHLCDGFIERSYDWARLMRHEVGHILGARHLPCNGQNIMCATPQTPADSAVTNYSQDDLSEICRYANGGVCGAPAGSLGY